MFSFYVKMSVLSSSQSPKQPIRCLKIYLDTMILSEIN